MRVFLCPGAFAWQPRGRAAPEVLASQVVGPLSCVKALSTSASMWPTRRGFSRPSDTLGTSFFRSLSATAAVGFQRGAQWSVGTAGHSCPALCIHRPVSERVELSGLAFAS